MAIPTGRDLPSRPFCRDERRWKYLSRFADDVASSVIIAIVVIVVIVTIVSIRIVLRMQQRLEFKTVGDISQNNPDSPVEMVRPVLSTDFHS
jgi:hypothetical protein